MTTKKQNELNFAFGESFKFARVQTRGAGLSMEQKFQCLTSTGADKIFINECLVRVALKKNFSGRARVEGVELLSVDFRHKAFVPKDKVLKIDILAEDLKQMTEYRTRNTENGGHR